MRYHWLYVKHAFVKIESGSHTMTIVNVVITSVTRVRESNKQVASV